MPKVFISESLSERGAARADTLEKLLVKAKDFYYNKGEFLVYRGEKITDQVYDRLEDELRGLRPASKVLKMTRAKTKTTPGRKSVKLPYFLGSLDKIWAGTGGLERWLETHASPTYTVSDKLDGYGVLAEYKNSQWHLYTAGDDSGKAMDISHLVPYMNLPKPKRDIVVRGELIISKLRFSRHGTEFKNSRNMVAGIATRIKPHESVQHFEFIAHELLVPRLAPSKSFAALERAGFTVVKHQTVQAKLITESRLKKYLATRKASSKYELDGIVVSEDKVFPLTVGSNPTSVIAFKDNADDQIVTAVVKSVEWEASKHNYLKPVVHIEPVELGGVTVKKATGKNAYTIVHGYPKRLEKKMAGKPDKPIGPGATVKLVRSGSVIPDILSVIKAARKPQMPDVDYDWNDTGVDIVAKEVSNLVADKRIATFFRTLAVENMDVSTVTKLADAGFDTVRKILRAKPANFLTVPGFKDRMATRLYENIRAKTKDVPLHTLMDASGVFGRGMGSRKVMPILKAYPKLIPNALAGKPYKTGLFDKIIALHGFEQTTAQQFTTALPKFVKWVESLGTLVSWKVPETTLKKGDTFAGQVVCFTGFRDKTLETYIEQHGGSISTGVSARTTILMVSSKADNGLKVQKAKSLGTVKIYTVEELNKRFKIK